MTKGIDYFESSGEFGTPVLLVPAGLVQTLNLEEAAMADQSLESGEVKAAYAGICEGNEWLRVVPFYEDGLALRMGEGRGPVFWIPQPDGALAVQWEGADSEEQLLAVALEHAGGTDWEEDVLFEAVEDRFYLAESVAVLMDSPDDTPLCEVSLPRGRYRVQARWVETDEVMAIVFRFARQPQ